MTSRNITLVAIFLLAVGSAPILAATSGDVTSSAMCGDPRALGMETSYGPPDVEPGDNPEAEPDPSTGDDQPPADDDAPWDGCSWTLPPGWEQGLDKLAAGACSSGGVGNPAGSGGSSSSFHWVCGMYDSGGPMIWPRPNESTSDAFPHAPGEGCIDDSSEPTPSGTPTISRAIGSATQTNAPILFTGGVIETQTDAVAPSRGAIRWAHQRVYNQRAGVPAIRVYYSGGGNGEIVVTDENVILKVDSSTTTTFPLANTSYDTLGEMQSAIDGLANWVATLAAGADSAASSTEIKETPLTAVNGTLNALMLQTHFWTEQGYNWSYTLWAHLAKDPNDPTGTILYELDAHRQFSFDTPAGDGIAYGEWESDRRIMSKLYHNMPGDPNHTYRLQRYGGDAWIFHDFDASWGAKAGKLWFMVGKYGDAQGAGSTRGDALEIVRHSDGRVDYVIDPSGHYIRYSYSSIGGRNYITQLDVWDDSSINDPNELIRSVEYTYRNGGTGHVDTGTTGDLILVESNTRKTSDTTSLGIKWHTHYRYYPGKYDDGNSPGIQHELKSVFRYRDVLAAVASSSVSDANDLITEADSVVATSYDPCDPVTDFRSCWFEYHPDHRVSSEFVHFGTSCCGGGAAGEYTYVYDVRKPQVNRNDWMTQTTETRPDGSTKYVLLNSFGQPLAMAIKGSGLTPLIRIWKYEYNTTHGQISLLYHPSACSDYNSATAANPKVTVTASGEVTKFDYHNADYWYMPKWTKRYTNPAQVNDAGEGEMLSYMTWEKALDNFNYRDTRVWLKKYFKYVSATVTQTEPAGSEAILVSEHSYEYWNDANDLDQDANTVENSDRIKTLTIQFPTTPNAENGSGVRPEIRYHFDRWGKLRFTRDAEGSVSYRAYDTRNGRWAMAITDIDAETYPDLPDEVKSPTNPNVVGLSNDDFNDVHSDFKNAVASPLEYTYMREFDLSARERKMTDRDGQVTYTSYLPREVRIYPSWDSGASQTRLPISQRVMEFDETEWTIRSTAYEPNAVSSGPPDGSETLSATKLVLKAEETYQNDDRIAEVRVWDDIAGNKFSATTYSYETDPLIVTVKDAGGGHTRITRNEAGQVTRVEQTNVTFSGDPNFSAGSRVDYSYANGGPLARVTTYQDGVASPTHESVLQYDVKGHLKVIAPDGQQQVVVDYDHLGRPIAAGTYKESASVTSATSAAGTPTGRLSLSKMYYDDSGRIYRTETYGVNPSTGTLDNDPLITNLYYDRRGQVVMADPPNGGAMILKYDADMMPIETWSCATVEPNNADVYTVGGVFDYANADIAVVEKGLITMDASGRPKIIESQELDYDDANGIDTTNYVSSYSHLHYDAASRLYLTAFYGSGTSDWTYTASGPAYSAPGSSSASVLMAKLEFDKAGRVYKMTNPRGIVQRLVFDDRFRVTKSFEADGTADERETQYKYDGLSLVTEITAINKEDDGTAKNSQVTKYDYGDAISSSRVIEIAYPKPTDGSGDLSSADDTVEYTYHRSGLPLTVVDQNGTTITLTYDGDLRLAAMTATTGAGVDSTINKIAYSYDTNLSLLRKVTSLNGATALNEVRLAYDHYLRLASDTQDPDDANGMTGEAVVGYTYDHYDSGDATAKNYFDRLSQITYPNGRIVHLDYGHGAAARGALNNALSRIGRIGDGSTAGSDILAQYDFAGMGRFVRRDHITGGSGSGKKGNDTANTLLGLGAEAKYIGFDRFGRVKGIRHIDYGGTTVDSGTAVKALDLAYQYDYNGNITAIATLHNRALSRVLTYDNLDRVTSDKQNLVTSAGASLSEWDSPRQQDWTLDRLGNWDTLSQVVNGTAKDETRTHNHTNELTLRQVAYEPQRLWINEDFTDNDEDGWVEISGAWAAGSGSYSPSAVTGGINLKGPASEDLAVALIDGSYYQSIKLEADVTATSGKVGFVYGYLADDDFWMTLVTVGSATNNARAYHYTTSGWSLENTYSIDATSSPFSIDCRVFADRVESGSLGASGPVPAGMVGIVASSTSISVDSFTVNDRAGPHVVDGRWISTNGDVRVDDGGTANNLRVGGDGNRNLTLYQGFRGSKYQADFDMTWNGNTNMGVVLHAQNPTNYMFVRFHVAAAGRPTLYEVTGNGALSSKTVGSVTSLTGSTTYACRVMIDDDPNDTALQRLRVYIDTNANGFDAGDVYLTSFALDDTWSGGSFGFWRQAGTSAQFAEYDNLEIRVDTTANNSYTDEDVAVDLDFDAAEVALTYDKNGNVTSDGLFDYIYGAWNRVVEVRLPDADSPIASIEAFEYDGLNRRVRKTVTNWGTGIVMDSLIDTEGVQAGDREERYFYAGWRVIEERTGGGDVIAQTVWGTEYIDAPICRDRNTKFETTSCLDESSRRYFYHQDINFRVTALTDESGEIVERYDYDAYGAARIYSGGAVANSGEGGVLLAVSSVGNPYMHQGLRRDDETGTFENRMRCYNPRIGRFMQRDPAGYVDGMNLYRTLYDSPHSTLDPLGLTPKDKGGPTAEERQQICAMYKQMYGPPHYTYADGRLVYNRLVIYVWSPPREWTINAAAIESNMETILRNANVNLDVQFRYPPGVWPKDGKHGLRDKASKSTFYMADIYYWFHHLTFGPQSRFPMGSNGPGGIVATVHLLAIANQERPDMKVVMSMALANILLHEIFYHGIGEDRDGQPGTQPGLEDTLSPANRLGTFTPLLVKYLRKVFYVN